MTNPSIWTPGQAVSAESSNRVQTFIASAGQTDFIITNFTYETGTNSLEVSVSGVTQRPGIDYIETGSNSFSLTSPVEDVGTAVFVRGLVEVSGNPQVVSDASNVSYLTETVKTALDVRLPEIANYAVLRAYAGLVTAYYVRGVTDIFDGGAGVFRVDAADATTADNGGTVLVDASGRRWKREFVGSISVKWFGARGDGVANDSAAIQSANDFAASNSLAIAFPAGEFAARGLNMSAPWFMDVGAKILYNGSSYSDYIVKCTGSGLDGNLNIDADNRSPELMLWVTGNNNNFETITVSNLISPAGGNVAAAVKFSGEGNSASDIIGRNLLNTGNFNASSPQLCTFGGGSNGTLVNSVRGSNVTSGVVNVASGAQQSVSSINLMSAHDNGIYNTAGSLTAGQITYNGTDEAVVVIGGSLSLGSLFVNAGSNCALGLANCDDIYVGEIVVRGTNIATIVKLRDPAGVAVGKVHIGKVVGRLVPGGVSGGIFYFPTSRGTISYLTIDNIDVEYIYATGDTIDGFCVFTACNGFNIGVANIRIVDSTNSLSSSNVFKAYFPSAPTKNSMLNVWAVKIVNAINGLTSSATARAIGLFTNLTTVFNGHIRTEGGGEVLREVQDAVPQQGLHATAAPTSSTWRQGQQIWRAYPLAGGSPGWVCVAAGTPGTWKDMPALTA